MTCFRTTPPHESTDWQKMALPLLLETCCIVTRRVVSAMWPSQLNVASVVDYQKNDWLAIRLERHLGK